MSAVSGQEKQKGIIAEHLSLLKNGIKVYSRETRLF